MWSILSHPFANSVILLDFDLFQDAFCTLRHLVRLDLSKNALIELPREFGNLTLLKRLDLYSNQLCSLPLSCVNLGELRWMDLKNNPLQTLWPDVIGNCLSEEECKQCAVNVSAWYTSQVHVQLKIIHKASYTGSVS